MTIRSTTKVEYAQSAAPADVRGPDAQGQWRLAFLDDLTDATDLLDWLENQGAAEQELVVLGPAHFVVRWR